MNRDEKILKLKLDIIFKRIFGDVRNEDIIKTFLEDLLELPPKSIQKILIDNVELVPAFIDLKFSRLDLKMKINDSIVNIEIQVNSEPYYNDRTLFYWSKIFSEELSSGDEYDELKQTICINIVNFNIFNCNEYHSHFQVMEKDRHIVLSDKLAIHFFELKKLSKKQNKKRMEDWLNLINAETEGDLMDIQKETSIPEVKEVIFKLRELSADEKVREEAYYREKRLHDEASAINGAKREGRAECRAEGRAEGEAKKEEEMIVKKYKKGQSAKFIADDLEIPLERVISVIEGITHNTQ